MSADWIHRSFMNCTVVLILQKSILDQTISSTLQPPANSQIGKAHIVPLKFSLKDRAKDAIKVKSTEWHNAFCLQLLMAKRGEMYDTSQQGHKRPEPPKGRNVDAGNEREHSCHRTQNQHFQQAPQTNGHSNTALAVVTAFYTFQWVSTGGRQQGNVWIGVKRPSALRVVMHRYLSV